MEISAKKTISVEDSESSSLEAVYSSLLRENDPKDLEDPQGRLQFIKDRSCLPHTCWICTRLNSKTLFAYIAPEEKFLSKGNGLVKIVGKKSRII
jgi:hypothetical protein